jgi:hypothetical protein
MEDNSEIYSFLGLQFDTYFFIHTIFNENFSDEISHQIYNVLINHNQITQPYENVIIYEFNLYKGLCNAICIQHTTNQKHIKFDKDNLENFFPTLIKADRNDLYTIKYDYDTKAYMNYHISDTTITKDTLDENLKENGDIPKLQINKIYNVLTSKPIH